MKKSEFLSSLANKLSALPKNERDKSIGYYSEMIDDRIEDGMSEEEAVSGLGNLDEIAEEIMLDATPISKFIMPNKPMSSANILYLILCSPLILLLFAVIILFYVGVWLVMASLFLIDLSFVLAGVAGVVASIVDFSNNILLNIFIFIGSLISVAIGIAIFTPIKKLSLKIWGSTTWFLRNIKIQLMRKRD